MGILVWKIDPIRGFILIYKKNASFLWKIIWFLFHSIADDLPLIIKNNIGTDFSAGMVPMTSSAPVPMDNFQPSYLSERRRWLAVLIPVLCQYRAGTENLIWRYWRGTKPVVIFHVGFWEITRPGNFSSKRPMISSLVWHMEKTV